LIISVISDGFLVDSQSFCKGKYHPTTNHLFTGCHLYAFCILLIIAIVTGDIKRSLFFCYKHPTVISDIFFICFFQTLGQISIYEVIANFKQHIYPLISTTRKIFTLFISYIIFDHGINFYQKIGILLTFSAIGYELYD
jgi:UDP-galactose transporter B1